MLMRLLRTYLRPYRKLLAGVVVLQLFGTIASLYLPSLNADIIDKGVANGDTTVIMNLGGQMLGVTLMGVPILVFGAVPHVVPLLCVALLAGAGSEVFNLGWTVTMQEHVPERMLSRAFSYDALGSFVAMPVGQLVAGPLAAAYGYRDVMVVGVAGQPRPDRAA